ncbi:MAG: hypothetical protein EOO38_23315, partial [Cytophagaceae bacterium]
MRNAFLVYVTGALLLLGTAVPVQAQYINPYTGTNWNNAGSAFLDTAIVNLRNQMMLNNMFATGRMEVVAAYNKQLKEGQSRIKSGKATTRFTAGAFPTDFWVKQCGGTTPEKRKQCVAEFAIQHAIWAEEVRARGVDTSDMAQSLGLTFVLAWEAQTGEKATTAQFKGITQDFRTMLLKDALYQGMTPASRQAYFEGRMINATDPVRLLRKAERTGDAATLQKARTS